MRPEPFAVGDMVTVRANSHKIRFLAQILNICYDSNTAEVEICVTRQRLEYPIEQLRIYND
tara:strand:- start:825 stop:1007 length:183 start_codon:yes stop_codon:yes gene_type:complete